MKAVYVTYRGEQVRCRVLRRIRYAGSAVEELEIRITARKSRIYDPGQIIRASYGSVIPADKFRPRRVGYMCLPYNWADLIPAVDVERHALMA